MTTCPRNGQECRCGEEQIDRCTRTIGLWDFSKPTSPSDLMTMLEADRQKRQKSADLLDRAYQFIQSHERTGNGQSMGAVLVRDLIEEITMYREREIRRRSKMKEHRMNKK